MTFDTVLQYQHNYTRLFRLPQLLRWHILPMERAGFFTQTVEPVNAVGGAFEVTLLNVNWDPSDPANAIGERRYTRSMYPADAPCAPSWKSVPYHRVAGPEFGCFGVEAESTRAQECIGT